MVKKSSKKLKLLFVCDWNSARSIMAEEIINNAYNKHFEGISAGVEASDYIDPFVITLVKDFFGKNIINAQPKSVNSLNDIKDIDLIITLTEAAYNFLKQYKKKKNISIPVEFWETPPPPDKNQPRDLIIEGYKTIYNELTEHIENRFLTRLN